MTWLLFAIVGKKGALLYGVLMHVDLYLTFLKRFLDFKFPEFVCVLGCFLLVRLLPTRRRREHCVS